MFTVRYELYYSSELLPLEGYKHRPVDTHAVNRRIVQALGLYLVQIVDGCLVTRQKGRVAASFQIRACSQFLSSSGIARYVTFGV